MLSVFLGTDRKRARAALDREAKRAPGQPLYISDAHSLDDFRTALAAGGGMFGEKKVVVFDGVAAHDEMREALLAALPRLADSSDEFFIFEEKVDAQTKKTLQKYAEKMEVFDATKKKEYPSVFKLADYLKKADRKNMWVAYQHELAEGNAPEAIHGVLFWGAKQYLLNSKAEKDSIRARALVAQLAELPHESRRRGEELEYALERFILCVR